ncbi:MAG: short-chain dehydrogenase [Candidatus Parabeggiatoa sp. nov. 1]|nr:MAG: short-chain dehydrogenase [Gammaproteobacteria bacterium]
MFFSHNPQDNTQKEAVLITASSSGIGAACAKTLCQQGFFVFAGVRDLAKGELLRRDIGDHLVPILLDVTDSDSIKSSHAQIVEKLAQDDTELLGVVNNATCEHHGPLEILPLNFARQEIEVDYLGTLAVVKAFLPLLRQSRGRIVNFSSINGRCVFESIGASCAAKYAVEAMSDALRLELAPWGIQVSIIEPGPVATPLWDKALQAFEALPDHVSSEKLNLYYPSWPEVVKQARSDKEYFYRVGMPVDKVVQVVIHALTSRKPKIRYLIGWRAKKLYLLKYLLPDRWFDSYATKIFSDQQ